MLVGRILVAAAAIVTASQSPAQSAERGDDFLKAPGRSFILENARVVDGTGAPALESVSVVIDDGVIVRIGRGRQPAPEGATRIDLAGHTILPGLVMMHEHVNYFSGAYVWDSQPGSVPKLLLAAGVTTARTAGSEAPQVDLNLKRRIDSGQSPGPRLFVTGAYLNDPSGGFLGDTIVSSAAEAADVTGFWARRGVSSMKVYTAISPDALSGAVVEANRRGIHVAGHLGEMSCTEAAKAGIHTIEHSLSSCAKDLGANPDAVGDFIYDGSTQAAKALIALLVAKKVVIVSTPMTTGTIDLGDEAVSMLSPDQRARFDGWKANRPAWMPSLSAMANWNSAHRAFERDFVAAGGRMLIGGDAADFGLVPGFTNQDSMIALAEAGFGPLEVIRMATSSAANFLKIDGEIGTVAVGKAADLLVVKGSPDRDMKAVRDVAYVFKGGVAYDPAKLRAAAKGQLGLH